MYNDYNLIKTISVKVAMELHLSVLFDHITDFTVNGDESNEVLLFLLLMKKQKILGLLHT